MQIERSCETAPSVDFSLESTSGGTQSLSQHRGSVVVVFYEAPDRTRDNAQIKQALTAYEPHVGLVLIAAGDMRAFDRPGARPVAAAAARAVARHYGLEILLDWQGALTRPPFRLDPAKSNVLLVDRAGTIVFRHSGILGSTETSRFFRALGNAAA